MRAKNPHFVKGGEAMKTEVDAVLQALAAKEFPTFEEIRAGLADKQTEDGTIHQALIDLGIEVHGA